MKKLLIILLFVTSGNLFAQSDSNEKNNLESGKATIVSKKKKVNSENSELTGYLDLENKKITVTVKVGGFFFESKAKKKHFDGPKIMEIASFPQAVYKGIITTDEDFLKNGTYKVKTTGKMNLHGFENDFEASGTITIKGKKAMVTAEFLVNREAFGVKSGYANMTDKDITVKLEATFKQ